MKSSRVTSRMSWAATLILGLFAAASPALADPGAVFFTNFDSGDPPEFSGITTTAPVQGWAGLVHGTNVFGGVMLHNDTGPYGSGDPDYLNVTVDGLVVFSETITNFPDTHTATYPNASTPPGVALAQYYDLGFLDFEPDSAYDLGLEPSLQSIPHTASTVTIEWFAGGAGWQGSYDESWAIDNVEVIASGPTPVAERSWGRVKMLFH
jgi:hypothetical protein